jgi:hypothetical protein
LFLAETIKITSVLYGERERETTQTDKKSVSAKESFKLDSERGLQEKAVETISSSTELDAQRGASS